MRDSCSRGSSKSNTKGINRLNKQRGFVGSFVGLYSTHLIFYCGESVRVRSCFEVHSEERKVKLRKFCVLSVTRPTVNSE